MPELLQSLLTSNTCFFCVCGLLIAELSDLCVCAMLFRELTDVTVLSRDDHEFLHTGIHFAYDPFTERLIVDLAYQITKITLDDANGERSITSDAFWDVLRDDLPALQDMLTVYKCRGTGVVSPAYVIMKDDQFSITLEYSTRTSILLQAARSAKRPVPLMFPPNL